LLTDGERGKEVRGLSPEDVSRMEHELETLGREFKLIEDSHGKNLLNLVLVAGYLRKLLENPRVLKAPVPPPGDRRRVPEDRQRATWATARCKACRSAHDSRAAGEAGRPRAASAPGCELHPATASRGRRRPYRPT
jgi:hypothetical protein